MKINDEQMLIPNAVKDEEVRDERDWVGNTGTYIKYVDLPDEFDIEDGIYNSQDKEGYKMSCGAQATINASNGSKKAKADYKFENQDKFRDQAIENGVGFSWGSVIIDIINLAREKSIIAGYYQTDTLLDILNAIYKTDLVVTGSNLINWYDSRDGLVKKAEKGTAHGFAIIGWDKNKKIGNYTGALKCKNSYGKNEFDNGCFWIPFDLVNEVLFNTKKAVIVVSDLDKLSQDDKYKLFLKLREEHKNKNEEIEKSI